MVAPGLVLRNAFSMDIYDRRIECLSTPITNFLDVLVDNLFAASYRYKCPLRTVVHVILT